MNRENANIFLLRNANKVGMYAGLAAFTLVAFLMVWSGAFSLMGISEESRFLVVVDSATDKVESSVTRLSGCLSGFAVNDEGVAIWTGFIDETIPKLEKALEEGGTVAIGNRAISVVGWQYFAKRIVDGVLSYGRDPSKYDMESKYHNPEFGRERANKVIAGGIHIKNLVEYASEKKEFLAEVCKDKEAHLKVAGCGLIIIEESKPARCPEIPRNPVVLLALQQWYTELQNVTLSITNKTAIEYCLEFWNEKNPGSASHIQEYMDFRERRGYQRSTCISIFE